MANPNKTVYATYPTTGRGTILTGTTLHTAFGTLRVGTSIVIRNFDTSNDILAALNLSTNDKIVVDAGKTIEINGEYVTDVWITNNSGASIEYQIVALGG